MKTWYLAIATTVATFVLLLVGGTVNPTGSSLACPDWPTCFGTFFPEMTGGVLFEHSHRVVATLVGAMTWLLAGAVWRTRKDDPGARKLAMTAAGLVLFQGLLGGITVIYRLPTMVSTTHLAIALGFFSLLIYLCFRLRPGDRPLAAGPRRALLCRITSIAAMAVYLQILIGALVRHTGAGHACPDLPLCHGMVWPPVFGAGQLHMIHRFGSLVVLVVVGLATVSLLREAPPRSLTRTAALLAPLLVVIQIGVGLWTVLSHIEWIPAMLHLGVAALILGDLLVARLALTRLPLVEAQDSSSSTTLKLQQEGALG